MARVFRIPINSDGVDALPPPYNHNRGKKGQIMDYMGLYHEDWCGEYHTWSTSDRECYACDDRLDYPLVLPQPFFLLAQQVALVKHICDTQQ